DHGDLRPADLAQLVLRPSQEVPALEADRPGDLCRLGQQAHHGHGAHRFARTRLADDAKNLALRQAITHAPHGLYEPAVGRELDRQILDGENSVSGPAIGSVDVGGVAGHARTRVCVGSNASRRASPMKLTVRAMTTMKSPGK